VVTLCKAYTTGREGIYGWLLVGAILTTGLVQSHLFLIFTELTGLLFAVMLCETVACAILLTWLKIKGSAGKPFGKAGAA
jgi:hypothetical protein